MFTFTDGIVVVSDVQVGEYRKVGKTRVGTARLTVRADGSLAYTNRRNETEEIDGKRFVQIWKTGINVLMVPAEPVAESTEIDLRYVSPLELAAMRADAEESAEVDDAELIDA